MQLASPSSSLQNCCFGSSLQNCDTQVLYKASAEPVLLKMPMRCAAHKLRRVVTWRGQCMASALCAWRSEPPLYLISLC